MKIYATAFFVLSTAALSVTPAEARTNWQGEAFITSAVGTTCAADGWVAGGHALITLMPANMDNNGTSSFIALHLNRRNAYSLKVSGALGGNKPYSAVGITSAGSNFTFAGSLATFVTAPSAVTANTNAFETTFSVTNWAGNTGCTVTFNGALVKRR